MTRLSHLTQDVSKSEAVEARGAGSQDFFKLLSFSTTWSAIND